MSAPPSAASSESTTRAVNLRVREEIRDLIDQAAKIQGRSRSDFMIDAARRAAEETLLDQTLFPIQDDPRWGFRVRIDGERTPPEDHVHRDQFLADGRGGR